ncbi:MAG TPA: HAMP domain-containing histidine kinase [Candidatus Onthousia faecipullorum]|uniref:histidine kinase n=1 Tax=Candidatus Onthousia faecipullorum TaxID=2840887 RepID=A0A9D1KBM0_9FIRM|nr:HAMP domain-containing histidine kinase [Candidatus Onthousia faecipullorum]
MMKNKLATKIFIYLAIFSLFILIFLFFFQVIFINTFYEWTKTRTIKNLSKDILVTERDTSLYDKLDRVSYKENVCIELTNSNGDNLYSSNGSNCRLRSRTIKRNFINSNKESKTYNLVNNFTKEKSIMSATKLSNNLYIFISTSLIPLDSTINIIEQQLIIVSIVVLLLSIVVAYFISKRLSNPIIKISKAAKLISKGKLKTNFDSGSDIKELVDLTNALNDMKDELSKTEELQRDLMANVSHDLKTPLTMIKAYAELILDININDKEKCKNNLNIIIEEVNRLNNLVNDILTLTKVESNLDNLSKSEFDLINLIKKIVKQHNIYVIKDGYSIEFIHDNIDKLVINADKKKIEQVIYNLLNNALNYTGEDKKVIIKVEDDDKDYTIMVIDSGKGIDKKEIDHIFDRYYRSKKNHKRYVYGTGLGLSIVKNILLLHNYPYGVKSIKNKGTTFYFKIKKDS